MSDYPAIRRGWSAIQGDPSLMPGMNFATYDEMGAEIVELVMEEFKAFVPVSLIIGAEAASKSMEAMLNWLQEITRVPVIRARLDEIASIRETS